MTIEQLLNDWEAGKPVQGVIMGGLGYDYDLAIWSTGMDILRQMQEDKFDVSEFIDCPTQEETTAKWEEYKEKVDKRINLSELTGAMYQAAWNIATVIQINGLEKAMEMLEEDRLTTFTKPL